MFRTQKPQAPRKVSRKKQPLPDEQLSTHSPAPIHPTLQMQSLIGNHATQRMIQRMPTATMIVSTLGKPKSNFGLIKNSTKYKQVLAKVTTYDNYVMQTTLGSNMGAIKVQMQQVANLLNDVMGAVSSYDGDTGKKAAYMQNLKHEIKRDLTSVSLATTKLMSSPLPTIKPKLFILLTSVSHAMPELKSGDIVGNDRGGTSEVTEYGGQNPGFFKGNKNTLYDPSQEVDPNMGKNEKSWKVAEIIEDKRLEMREKHGKEEGDKILGGMENEYQLGVGVVGIDSQNARMTQRDIATSRLNQILGQSIIAKAQMSVQKNGDGKMTEGSLMEKAKGKSGVKMIQQGGFYDPSSGETKDTGNAQQVNLQDPKLMQMLSKLHLIDLLAFQIDRNQGNYYIQVDPNGNVLGMTGIDNDFSFGTNTNITRYNEQLPSISRYVDEEMATAIINLDPDLLKLALADLLSPDELEALATRLQKLKDVLKPLQDKDQLLKPGQWTTAMAQNLLEENNSYYAKLVKDHKAQNG